MPEDQLDLHFTITATREQLSTIARARGYTAEIPKTAAELPPRDTPYSIQEMVKPNPLDEVAWLDAHIRDFLAELASIPFIEAAKRAKDEEIAATAEHIRAQARASIS